MSIFYIVLLTAPTNHLSCKGQIAGNERFNSYRKIMYYDNIPEDVLPPCLLEYYKNLTWKDIAKTEQVIHETMKERRLYVTTRSAGKGYLSMTRCISDDLLEGNPINHLRFIVNGAPLKAEDIHLLLRVKSKHAKTMTYEKEGE